MDEIGVELEVVELDLKLRPHLLEVLAEELEEAVRCLHVRHLRALENALLRRRPDGSGILRRGEERMVAMVAWVRIEEARGAEG